MADLLELLIEGMRRETAFFMILADDLRDGPDIGAACDAYAEALGKTAEELTAAEKKQIILDAVLRQYEDGRHG